MTETAPTGEDRAEEAEGEGDDASLRDRIEASLRRWRDLTVAAWERGVRIVPALDLGLELGKRFSRLNGSVLIGHVAYRTFMWLMPLVLVAIGLLGYSVANGLDMVEYGREAGLDGETLDNTADEVGEGGLRIVAVGGFALILATRSLVRALFFVFTQAWEVEPYTPRRIVRATGLTLIGSLLFVAVMGTINSLSGRGPVLFVGAGVAGAALTFVIVLVMSWLLPHRGSGILNLVPGTAVAATGIVLIDVFGGLYFPRRLSEASDTYGSIGFALVLLFFLWLVAFLLVGSAFVNAVWCDRAAVLDGRPWVAAPELLPHWLRRLLPMEDSDAGEPPDV